MNIIERIPRRLCAARRCRNVSPQVRDPTRLLQAWIPFATRLNQATEQLPDGTEARVEETSPVSITAVSMLASNWTPGQVIEIKGRREMPKHF